MLTMANLKKKQIVKSLTQALRENSNFVLLEHKKITHKQLEELRKSLADKGKLKVIKNSLMEKAFNKVLPEIHHLVEIKKKFFPLKNQNAALFLKNDSFQLLKIIKDYQQKNFPLKFKFGFLENQIYDETELKKIATLPEKNILLAQLINRLKSPFGRLNYTLNYPLTKIIYILKNKKINS